MTPTMKLRFVERETKVQPFDCLYPTVTIVRVLQQWWERPRYYSVSKGIVEAKGEWRDVPVETEELK